MDTILDMIVIGCLNIFHSVHKILTKCVRICPNNDPQMLTMPSTMACDLFSVLLSEGCVRVCLLCAGMSGTEFEVSKWNLVTCIFSPIFGSAHHLCISVSLLVLNKMFVMRGDPY